MVTRPSCRSRRRTSQAWPDASRATVNRVLREEEARGTVKLGRGRTTVLDAEALAPLAGASARAPRHRASATLKL